MSWWLTILLVYLVICWTAWLVVLRIGIADKDGCGEHCAALRHERPVLYWLNVVITTLFMGPLLPLLASRCLWSAVSEARAWKKFARIYREAIVEPIHPANVPQAGQEHFDRCAPHLLRLGFVPAGTYLSKPEPMAIYLQCLLSRAGEAVADIALVGDGLSVSFVSVLENGHVLETTCSAEPMAEEDLKPINDSGHFTANMLAGHFSEDGLEGTYRKHRELLAGLERRLDCGTLHLSLEQVPALKRYENAVFGEVLFSLGKVDNRPETPRRPAGTAKRISVPASGVVLPSAGGTFGATAAPFGV
jgi:hypothetical protein